MAQMFDMRIRALFFDRPKVRKAVDRAKRRVLSRIGAAIRVNAKRAMEQSARAGRIPERSLPPELRKRRQLANAIRRRQGKPRLRPLRRPSRPGQAPAAGRSSPLNRLLFFAWDPRTKSVVVGPMGFRGSNAPLVLEEGGRVKIGDRAVKVAPRPYMGPALRKELPNMPRKWARSVRG